jgi:hypothetical protein
MAELVRRDGHAHLLAQLNAENAFTLAHGHWPQLSAAEKRDAKINRGPLNPQQLNRYSYVLNNPLKYTDPDGHDADCAEDFSSCEGAEVVNTSSIDIFVHGERINSETDLIEEVTVLLRPGQSSIEIGILDVDDIIIPGQGRHNFISGARSRGVFPDGGIRVVDDNIIKQALCNDCLLTKWEPIKYKTWLSPGLTKYDASMSFPLPRGFDYISAVDVVVTRVFVNYPTFDYGDRAFE